MGQPHDDHSTLFAGDGEMRALCRAHEWAGTPLGPPDGWSPALRTLVRAALASPFPINLWCGPELVLIYNDAYRRVLGDKHPGALGRSGRAVWEEIWPEIAPMFARIAAGGPPTFQEDAPFVVERREIREDAWFTFALSGVRDEAGELVAYLNVVSETTGRVLAERETRDARAAAERAREELNEVFAHAPSFFAVLRGPELTFVLVNEAYYQTVGHRPLLGRPLLEAIPELQGQGYDAILHRVLASGEPFIGRALPVMLQRTRGAPAEQRFVDAFYIPVTDGDGVRRRVIAHGADVTEHVLARREVERLLGESEESGERLRAANAKLEWQALEMEAQAEQLQRTSRELEERTRGAERERRRVEAVLASISDAFYTLDRDWRFTYVNERAAQLLQQPGESLLGRMVWEVFPEARGTIFDREFRRALDTQAQVVFEEYYAPFGQWFEVRVYPSREGLAVYFQDVTQRHAAAEALAESEARFRAVQDASPDASVLARAVRDASGRIVDFRFTYANAATQPVLIGSDETIVGRTMREAFPEAVAAGRLEVYARIVETGVPWQQDVHYERGSLSHGLRVTAVKVGDGVHIAAGDLSERMRAERERERLLAEAERARTEAEEANRAKSQFLATMSHELRTPLNAIAGYADLLLLGVRGTLTEGQRSDVERLKRSGHHLLALINDILNFAKLEAGQVEFALAETALGPLLAGLDDLIAPQLAAKSLRFVHGACDPAVRVHADGEKVRQVLLNLLTNAVKFTDPGGEVELSCEADEAMARVHVRDTGRGIAPDQQAAVFDAFVQVDRHLTPTSQQGVGLGLAISRDLAVGMGGTLTVRSGVGRGSTFTLSLPRVG